MTWAIEFERSAAREFRRLDPTAQRRIRDFFQHRVLNAEHPRVLGKPLKGKHSDLWRYRIGDYRVVAEIQDGRMVILLVRLGHRRDIYRS